MMALLTTSLTIARVHPGKSWPHTDTILIQQRSDDPTQPASPLLQVLSPGFEPPTAARRIRSKPPGPCRAQRDGSEESGYGSHLSLKRLPETGHTSRSCVGAAVLDFRPSTPCILLSSIPHMVPELEVSISRPSPGDSNRNTLCVLSAHRRLCVSPDLAQVVLPLRSMPGSELADLTYRARVETTCRSVEQVTSHLRMYTFKPSQESQNSPNTRATSSISYSITAKAQQLAARGSSHKRHLPHGTRPQEGFRSIRSASSNRACSMQQQNVA